MTTDPVRTVPKTRLVKNLTNFRWSTKVTDGSTVITNRFQLLIDYRP